MAFHKRPLVYVGLSAWIIQDGNYGDFSVGQEAQFALEFYSTDGLRPAQDGPSKAEHVSESSYRVRGQVVFCQPKVWAIDVGDFVAFEERPPPRHAIFGACVEGEVNLGIDPFFYFERLHRTEGMPPLSYTWYIHSILRDATPWIEEKDAEGRTYRTRDGSRKAFVSTSNTDAWHDDGGDGEYVLVCERIAGPNRPTPVK